MDTKVTEQYEALREKLKLFAEKEIEPVKRLTGSLEAIGRAIEVVRKEVGQVGFKNEQEEIRFFKYYKPRFYAEQYFAVAFYNLQNDQPKEGGEILRNYYTQELSFIKRFFDHHRFLYQYFQLDGCELDAVYFVRGVKPNTVFIPNVRDFDPTFSTVCDNLFAKFLANERLQDELVRCLYPPLDQGIKKIAHQLKWTGEKSSLIELAYALYCSGQINGGKLTLAELMAWLEDSFEISLSRYSHRFAEIKMRKSASKTRFLDGLRENLLNYMDE